MLIISSIWNWSKSVPKGELVNFPFLPGYIIDLILTPPPGAGVCFLFDSRCFTGNVPRVMRWHLLNPFYPAFVSPLPKKDDDSFPPFNRGYLLNISSPSSTALPHGYSDEPNEDACHNITRPDLQQKEPPSIHYHLQRPIPRNHPRI